MIGSAIEWLKLRRNSQHDSKPQNSALSGNHIISALAIVAGGALVFAMVHALLRGFREELLGVMLGGLALAALGIWRMGIWRLRAPAILQGHLLPLCLILVAFVGPREEGWMRINWSDNSVRMQTGWSGGENCSGTNITGPISLQRFRPNVTWRSNGLSGSVGELIGQRLQSRAKSGAATARLMAHIDLSEGCYLPFYKSIDISGTLNLDIQLFSRKPQVNCSSHQILNYQLSASMVGIASCRDLKQLVANKLLAEISKHARRLTGHQR